MAEFKVGDTVQLKSGSPAMTIAQVNSQQALCQWFDNKDAKGQWFSLAVLQPAKPPQWDIK